MKKKWLMLAIVGIVLIACTIAFWPKTAASKFERLAYDSTVLQKTMPINVYLPKGYRPNKSYPVLYLIHGFGIEDDENQWLTDIVKTEVLDALIEAKTLEPLIVVSPKVDASCGYNTGDGKAFDDEEKGFSYGQYETYFIEEMIPYIETQCKINVVPTQRMIGGFSGGGNAALYYAFKYDGLFGKVGAFCPALYTDELLKARPDIEMFLYPTQALREERDPISLARNKTFDDLNILIETPEYDRWVKGTLQLHDVLNAKGIAHGFGLEVSSHSPRGVREQVVRYLQFFSPIQ